MTADTEYSELGKFVGDDLTTSLSRIEQSIARLDSKRCQAFLETHGVNPEAMEAASEIKKLSGQINVTIHALGILACLPHLLLENEQVETVSLGAGNTGRKFDLETNLRIAEFKFINWRGGPESIRQNGIFKDFFELAEEKTVKKKYLYLLGTDHALRFFNGGRSLTSVLSKNDATRIRFRKLYGDRYLTVRDYFAERRDSVDIVDVSSWVPAFVTQ